VEPYPHAGVGSNPNALAFSPDGRTLYVANAGDNDVAVVRLASDGRGDRVAGLIPTGWYPTGLALSSDGNRLYAVSAKGLGAGPNPGGPRPVSDRTTPPNQYIGSMIKGLLSTVAVPSGAELDRLTARVVHNNGFDERGKVRVVGRPNQSVVRYRIGDPSPIKHVLYVVNENRTYDQVLGDLPKGNGDPSLTLFGGRVAPNHHKLANKFITLDNLYAAGEVSNDGWEWTVGANANSLDQRTWPMLYGRPGLLLHRRRRHARRGAGQGPEQRLRLGPAEPAGHQEPELRLLGDCPSPKAMVADSDWATGKLVDTVSHSKFWGSTAIFIIEDDAQDGPDHVDAHRTVSHVVSPYTQLGGKVDSTCYSTVSMLRTMELILGLRPMTQFDAAATPMFNSFTDDADFSSYQAEKPEQSLTEPNPPDAPLSAESARMDFSKEDLAPERCSTRRSGRASRAPATGCRSRAGRTTTTADRDKLGAGGASLGGRPCCCGGRGGPDAVDRRRRRAQRRTAQNRSHSNLVRRNTTSTPRAASIENPWPTPCAGVPATYEPAWGASMGPASCKRSLPSTERSCTASCWRYSRPRRPGS